MSALDDLVSGTRIFFAVRSLPRPPKLDRAAAELAELREKVELSLLDKVQLILVDETLSRRPALAGCKTRVEKIEKCIAAAKQSEQLRAALDEARIEIKLLKTERDDFARKCGIVSRGEWSICQIHNRAYWEKEGCLLCVLDKARKVIEPFAKHEYLYSKGLEHPDEFRPAGCAYTVGDLRAAAAWLEKYKEQP